MCSRVGLREYRNAPSTVRSASVGSASRRSAWSGWVAMTTESYEAVVPSRVVIVTPSGCRATARTGVAVCTAESCLTIRST